MHFPSKGSGACWRLLAPPLLELLKLFLRQGMHVLIHAVVIDIKGDVLCKTKDCHRLHEGDTMLVFSDAALKKQEILQRLQAPASVISNLHRLPFGRFLCRETGTEFGVHNETPGWVRAELISRPNKSARQQVLRIRHFWPRCKMKGENVTMDMKHADRQ